MPYPYGSYQSEELRPAPYNAAQIAYGQPFGDFSGEGAGGDWGPPPPHAPASWQGGGRTYTVQADSPPQAAPQNPMDPAEAEALQQYMETASPSAPPAQQSGLQSQPRGPYGDVRDQLPQASPQDVARAEGTYTIGQPQGPAPGNAQRYGQQPLLPKTAEEQAQERIMQMTANMPLSQQDQLHMQRTQAQLATVQQLLNHGRIDAVHGLNLMERLSKELNPYHLRQQRQLEQTRQLQHAQLLEDNGLQAQADAARAQIAAQGALQSAAHVPTGDGRAATVMPNGRGGFDAIHVPGDRQEVPAGAQTEMAVDQHRQEQHRAESKHQREAREREEKHVNTIIADIEDNMRKEVDDFRKRESAHNAEVHRRRQEARKPADGSAARELKDEELPPPPTADPWVHDPSRYDEELHRRTARRMSMIGRPYNRPAPPAVLTGPQQPKPGESPRGGQIESVVTRAAALPEAQRSRAQSVMAEAQKLLADHGAAGASQLPPAARTQYLALDRELRQLLAPPRQAPSPVAPGPAAVRPSVFPDF